MPETIERDLCPVCGRPVYRYVIVRVRKSPGDTETSKSWWFHDGLRPSFACEQRIDG